MITSKFSVIAILIITGICFGVFVYPYMKKKKEASLVAHVSAGGGNAGQIVGECRFSLVMCRFDFCPANQKFFVVGNSQCTATIQTQNILCGQGQHQTGQVDETEELFHCIYTLKHLWKLYLIKQQ